jgi:hypothetical protein
MVLEDTMVMLIAGAVGIFTCLCSFLVGCGFGKLKQKTTILRVYLDDNQVKLETERTIIILEPNHATKFGEEMILFSKRAILAREQIAKDSWN